MSGRTLDFLLVHQCSAFADSASAWLPRLLIVARGSTARVDVALPPARAAVYNFGAVGVSWGAPLAVSESFGARPLQFRGAGLADVEGLIQALAQAGLPGQPDVEGVADTGDAFQHSTLAGRLDGIPFHVELSQMSSGYRGRGAEAFAAGMRRILEIAGVDAGDPRCAALVAARRKSLLDLL